MDFEHGTIHIKRQLQCTPSGLGLEGLKTDGSYRKIKMTAELADFLWDDERRSLTNEHVISRRDGKPINPKSLQYAVNQTSKVLSIPWSFHDLRHTHATTMLEAGVPAHIVAHRLGHSDPAITLRTYSHNTVYLIGDSLERFSNRFKVEG